MHYWGSPIYKDHILKFFVILDPEGKLIENPTIESTSQFFLAVLVAKMKKYLMENKKKLEDILSKVRKEKYKYFEVLSFKYHLSNETCLNVNGVNSKGRRDRALN